MGRPRNVKPTYKLKLNKYGRYTISWTEGSETRRVSTGKEDRESAELFLAQFIVEQENSPPAQPIVSVILSGYYDDRKAHGAKSVDDIFRNCKNIGRHIGKLQTSQISQSVIKQYAANRLDEGVGNASVIQDLATFRAALHWAEREQWIDRAPKFRMPLSPPPPRERWATREEIDKLLRSAEQTLHVRLFILIAVSTGARKAAITELKWSQVNFERSIINFGEGSGNKRRSIIPMNDGLKAELEYYARIATTEYVLEYRGKPAGNLKKSFQKCAIRAGLPDITPHVLRHTAATWMVMSGVPIREGARYLGMSEVIFERVYGKHSPDYLKDASEALNIFGNSFQKPYLKNAETTESR
jgi:integrase